MRKSRRLSGKPWTRRYVEPVVTADPETGEPVADFRDVAVPGAQIRDRDSGLIYRVTIDAERKGGAAVTFLSIETTGAEQQITADTVPLSELVKHTREVLRATAEDGPMIFRTAVPLPGAKPPLEQIARDYREQNREALAAAYGIGRSTLDRWIRECRETVNPDTGKPYLERARTGRPRKSQTPGGKPSPGQPNK